MSIVDRCRVDSPLRCQWRADAMAREDFRYIEGWGWVWLQSLNPVRPWTTCPGCDGHLPTMAGAVEGIVRRIDPLEPYRQADGADQGEGAE